MKDAVIYALVDPFTKAVRYVGKTVDLKARVRYGHLSRRDINDKRMHKANWLRGLASQGAEPDVIELERVAGGESWQERERHWIAHYRAAGAPLTNMTEGGDGGGRLSWTPEDKRKAAERMRGKPRSPEVIEKMRRAQQGRAPSEKCREAQRAAVTGKKQSREQVEQRLPFMRGNKFAAKQTYIVVSPSGESHDVGLGLGTFCKERGLTESRMRSLAKGDPRRKTHKGWTCIACPISKGAAVPA
jgi:hypothetical protein